MRAGDIIKEKYKLTRLCGAGGMGEVFEAVNIRIDRKVAIKLLKPDLVSRSSIVERFLREARSAGQVGSEHIVEILDVDETEEGVPFLVMEYLEGQDLGRLLYYDGPLEPSRAVGLVLQACRGLEAAHRKGIIHRDVKPANLFLSRREDGTEWLKILDFGIAKFRGPLAPDQASLTVTGSTVGTPRYMAPEHLREAKNVDERADVFSLGVILYESLTGDHPFQADTFADLIIQMVTVGPTPPSEIRSGLDRKLDEVVLKALECDVSDRYADMGELMEALAPFVDASPPTEPEPPKTGDRSSPTITEADTLLPEGDDPWAERSPTEEPADPTKPASNRFKDDQRESEPENEDTTSDDGVKLWLPAVIVGAAIITVVALFAIFFDEVPHEAVGGRPDGSANPASSDASDASDADTDGDADGQRGDDEVSITVEGVTETVDSDVVDETIDADPVEPRKTVPRVKVRPTPRRGDSGAPPQPAPEKRPPLPTGDTPGGEPSFDHAFPSST